MRYLLVGVCVAALLSGCSGNSGGGEMNAGDDAADSAGSANLKPEGPAASGSFDSPEATIKTLIAAAIARDLDLLSQCFSGEAPGEFGAIVNKTASDEELDSFAEFFTGAKITGSQTVEEDKAVVDVKLTSRDEKISLVKTADGWKVLDF